MGGSSRPRAERADRQLQEITVANADAQFVFDTNLSQVRKEIEGELGRISTAVNEMNGTSVGGDLLGGVSKKLKRDAEDAIKQIRAVQEEARQQVESGVGLQAGQQTDPGL